MVNKKQYKDLYRKFWENNRSQDSFGCNFMRCVNCNKKIYEQDVVVHNFSHIKSKGAFPELAMNPDNIEFLCVACHASHHTGGNVNNQLLPRS